ncbi:MoxR-like ATPase [Halospina denitrificans]|uniref:MoxR-like ATPase n=1 Tax=Halospina denitrificans TaxID=332522 RepID=A0A4R7JM13_9GAMM|nr:MoxR family ATPase [Halospina denitrificans]TDT38546.1 MoxR-like ATPase [Halospina denitrificans]
MEEQSPKEALTALHRNLSSVILGKSETMKLLLVALICRGHVLLEDVPGLGKTTLARALATSLNVDFKRLQCTPDLLPSDITGVNIFSQEEHAFRFIPGPVFTNILVADEINRATPRSQSALLEAMAEGQVSLERETHALPDPFLVIATQNPIEFSGTYPLPEAQMDRFFMRISLGYPEHEDEVRIMRSQRNGHPLEAIQPVMSAEQLQSWQRYAERITLSDTIMDYIARIVRATRDFPGIRLGASPRGSLALMRAARAMALLSGEKEVTPERVQQVAPSVLLHRLVFKDASLATPQDQARVLERLMEEVAVPDNPSADATA